MLKKSFTQSPQIVVLNSHSIGSGKLASGKMKHRGARNNEQEMRRIRNKILQTELRRLNFQEIDVDSDGNCLMRALSVLYKMHCDAELSYEEIRHIICEYFEENMGETLPDYIDELYINKMRQDGTWGGDDEIKAFADVFEINCKIYHFSHQMRLEEHILSVHIDSTKPTFHILSAGFHNPLDNDPQGQNHFSPLIIVHNQGRGRGRGRVRRRGGGRGIGRESNSQPSKGGGRGRSKKPSRGRGRGRGRPTRARYRHVSSSRGRSRGRGSSVRGRGETCTTTNPDDSREANI